MKLEKAPLLATTVGTWREPRHARSHIWFRMDSCDEALDREGARCPGRRDPRVRGGVAVETGGAFYVSPPGEDIFTPFGQIIEQLRQQYVLGFVPAKLDGKRHSISVR